jgi:hypothetical protein
MKRTRQRSAEPATPTPSPSAEIIDFEAERRKRQLPNSSRRHEKVRPAPTSFLDDDEDVPA